MLKKLFSALSFLLILLLSALFLLAGSKSPSVSAPAQALSGVGSIASADHAALVARFGAPIPYLSTVGSGRVEDTVYAGGYARTFVFTDTTGLTVSAVRPAAAAPLLNPGNLSFDTSQICRAGDMQGLPATGKDGTYVYFSDQNAAYCLHIHGQPAAMDAFLHNLQFTN